MSLKQLKKLPPSMQNDEVKKYISYLEGQKAVFALKRFFDVFVCFLLLLITSPVLIICGLLVKCTSKGPVFYRQERVGRYDKDFRIFKFRTMVQNADKIGAKLTVGDRDPRITKFGHFLRKTRLDEFPQFFNVLKGDMSLVGTRPPTLDEWEKYELRHRARLSIKPGITGLWQVSGRSKITDFEEVVKLDKQYITDWSMGLDFRILFKTIQSVIKKDGAK